MNDQSKHWGVIRKRLHEETGLRDPLNEFAKILDGTLGKGLDKFESSVDEIVIQAFLLTATGEYLDMHGKDRNIIRIEGETDDEYRRRILNSLNLELTVPYCLSQGMYVWAAESLDSNIRTSLSSNNTYNSKFYFIVPKSEEATNFARKQMILDDIAQLLVKGWD